MKRAKAIIIGHHPLYASLLQQYEARWSEAVHQPELTVEGVSIDDYDELCLLSDGDDARAVAMLGELAGAYHVENHGGKRLTCHMLVQSNQTLRMLQTCDLCDAVRQKIDVYPFSTDEIGCRSVVLDYEPITLQSEKHVHLVVFGMGEMAEMLAIQAAYRAHYPNYVRDHSLRTRITMIAEDATCRYEAFVARYKHLLDNCYYRIVKPSEEQAVVDFHHPMYEGKREDFVDVEWEFVESDCSNADMRKKLQLWAKDQSQLLTIAMAYQDGDQNVAQALYLPNELYKQHIPIYFYSPVGSISSIPSDLPNLHCFGMIDKGYDVTLPLVRMAKNVNYIYDRCYQENIVEASQDLRFSVEIDATEREASWARLSNVKRQSNICNAMTIPMKMRSIGLQENDWDKFYDMSQQDIELLGQVEHNRWSVEELILGFRPCTDAEQKIIAADVAKQKDNYKARKIHYDLRAYKELKPDKTGRSVQLYDLCLSACLPLIAKAFADEEEPLGIEKGKGGQS